MGRSFRRGPAVGRIVSVLAVTLGVLALAGCQGMDAIGQAMGVSQPQDDEAIMSSARLSIPPDYNLRPPQSGTGKAQARAASVRGRQAIFGNEKPETAPETPEVKQASRSAGEAALIRHAAGNQAVDSGIRSEVDQETEKTNKDEQQFTDKLLHWRKAPKSDKSDEGKNADTRPVSPDSVPVIKKQGDL